MRRGKDLVKIDETRRDERARRKLKEESDLRAKGNQHGGLEKSVVKFSRRTAKQMSAQRRRRLPYLKKRLTVLSEKARNTTTSTLS